MNKNKKLDLTGKTFSRLLVVCEAPRRNGKRYWTCTCSCSSLHTVEQNNLTSGRTTSCGCLNQELRSSRCTHRMSRSPEYRSWAAMWQRCTDPKINGFIKYQYRRPPPEWRDFSVFFTHVGPRPSPSHSLERVNNNLSYGPGNVGWATPSEQARNRGSNHLVRAAGDIMSLIAGCELVGLKYRTVRSRLARNPDISRVSGGLLLPHG